MSEKVVVIGAGIMGIGISQVLLTAGFRVALTDVDAEILESASERIRANLEKMKEKGLMDEDQCGRAAMGLTLSLAPLEEVGDAFFVMEAAPENLSLKKGIFSEVSRSAPEDTVFATNTSELSVTAIAGATHCPDRVIGMHWFNPAPLMRLIEVVRGVKTSEETVGKAISLAGKAGKEVVVVKDRQGFVTTRVLSAFLLECYRVLDEGVSTMEDIDKAVKLAFNHPMGPFELSDLIGLDTLLSAAGGLRGAYGDRFMASQRLVKLVEAGKLGVKSGEGFYRYEGK